MNFEKLPVLEKVKNNNFYTYNVGVKDVMLRSNHHTVILNYLDSVIFLNETDICQTKEEEINLIKEFMSYYN